MFPGQGGDGMVHTIQANSIAYNNCFHILVGNALKIEKYNLNIVVKWIERSQNKLAHSLAWLAKRRKEPYFVITF